MLPDVESNSYAISFPLLFFNEWLEIHGIMRNQFQELQLYGQSEEFYN